MHQPRPGSHPQCSTTFKSLRVSTWGQLRAPTIGASWRGDHRPQNPERIHASAASESHGSIEGRRLAPAVGVGACSIVPALMPHRPCASVSRKLTLLVLPRRVQRLRAAQQRRRWNKTRTFLTLDQISLLVDACRPRWRAALWTAGLAGLRWSETAGLRIRDIDADANVIHVRQTITELNSKRILDVTEPKSQAGNGKFQHSRSFSNN